MAGTERCGLQVNPAFAKFIETEAIPGSGVDPESFWQGFSDLVHLHGDEQRALLARRKLLQRQIDAWYRDGSRDRRDPKRLETFLREIGYLLPDEPDFEIETDRVDPEIAWIAAPQLVVPSTNARYALNAANARWGSLYDALYGTDALGMAPSLDAGYNHDRGKQVIAWVRNFLDETFPLAGASHSDVEHYRIGNRRLIARVEGADVNLSDPAQYCGHQGRSDQPDTIILRNNGLHVLVRIDATHPIGRTDRAGVSDVVLESALTTIVDCEDSVAAVNAVDKAHVYRNWLGLMTRELAVDFDKGGQRIHRRLLDDIPYTAADGSPAVLRRQALLLVRNVGLLMTNPAVLDRNGREVQESLMDAICTVLIARHDLKRADGSRNSPAGSVYVVVPKLHGPDEVEFVDRVFRHVETVLDLPPNTVKIGIMDEERRTSVNLKACIRAARSRVAFINTGFLDRTGDEIHTAMNAGAFLRKADIRSQPWIASYENRNVDIGLACGFMGRAQIGKGMWTASDLMQAMLEQKIGHPEAGANCAWVPSPTAATLHATHYHRIDVVARQRDIAAGGPRGTLADLLSVPLAAGVNWSDDDIRAEIDNNAQGILGYVVRWIDQGVGCSKVPDINNVAQMEDRATCRISSQMLANWIHHGVVTEDQVMSAMRRMAETVDAQNAGDPLYRPMAPSFDGVAFRAACDLVFQGRELPSGYTEPVLHSRRLEILAREAAHEGVEA